MRRRLDYKEKQGTDTLIKFLTYNYCMRKKRKFNGGVYMIAITISGFLAFLGSAVFILGYISNNSLFP